MGPEHLTEIFALIGIVVVLSALLSGAVERSGLPQVAIFLLIGAVLGPFGLGLLDVRLDSRALEAIATLALVLVLFSDAMFMDLEHLRERRRLALVVLGPGTLLPAVVIGVAAWSLLDVAPPMAAILGAALASTDPVLLRGLLRHRNLPPATRLALRLESGANDAVLLPIVVLAMVFLRPPGTADDGSVGGTLVGLFLLGPMLGGAVGWVGITVLERVRARAGVRRDYESMYALGLALAAFAAAEAVGGSGFLASFAAGVVIAVLDVDLCDCFFDFGEATAEMFLLLAFVAFGASLIWSGADVATWRTLVFAAVALLTRTVVLLGLLRFADIDRRDRTRIAWLGPRGLSSLLLVLLPVFAGIPGAEYAFAVTCLVVLVSVALHGGGIALYVRRLTGRTPPGEGPSQVVAAPPVPERITIVELQELERQGEPLTIVDARSERTHERDPLQARGATRIPPDDAVRSARERKLSQQGTVVVYCA